MISNVNTVLSKYFTLFSPALITDTEPLYIACNLLRICGHRLQMHKQQIFATMLCYINLC